MADESNTPNSTTNLKLQHQTIKQNIKNKISKYDDEPLGTNGSKNYGIKASGSSSSFISHQDSSEQRDREREYRMRKSRLVSPTSASSSPVPQNRLKQMSPSEMSNFLGSGNEPVNRPYHSSQIVTKENSGTNDSNSSPNHYYSVSESQSSTSLVESSRDRQGDRSNGYNNINNHGHYHSRHNSQMDHYRTGKSIILIFSS